MTWFTVAAVVVGTLVTADAQKKQGQQQQMDVERQAETEKLSAEGEEIKRRERLNKVLSANVRSAAASGIKTEGSSQAVALDTAKNISSSEGAESLSQRIRQDMLKREGNAAKQRGSGQAASTLLQGGISAYQLSKS
jgi:hypothetical protein